jgi:uncharacterized protein YlxW (UPF0749 family)
MSVKTRLQKKAISIHGCMNENEAQSAESVDQEVTLQDVFNKLNGLDHIETKLDNLHNRVEHLEERVSKIEDNEQERKKCQQRHIQPKHCESIHSKKVRSPGE